MLILGASGLIGSFITDCFLYANKMLNAEIMIYAVSRNIEQLKKRFEGSSFIFIIPLATLLFLPKAVL